MCSHICSTCWWGSLLNWGQVRATTIMMQRCRIAAGTSSLPVSSTGGHCVCVHRYYIHLLLPSYNNRSVERRWSWVSVQLELTWCSRFRLVSLCLLLVLIWYQESGQQRPLLCCTLMRTSVQTTTTSNNQINLWTIRIMIRSTHKCKIPKLFLKVMIDFIL